MNKTIGAVLGVIILAGVVWYAAANRDNRDNKENMTEPAMTEDKMEKKDESMMKDEETMMQKAGVYADYTAERVADEQKAGNKVVLFFHAPWCPFCKAANTAFQARTNEIPEGVVVLKTDYDSNTELKQKYGVTYQHTFVQIDSSGNLVSKWNGGDIDNLKKYLK